ncbi:MAG: efflux RND transporter permease subunit, partial [Myxococcota bacterium]
IEMSRTQMAELGITPQTIAQTLQHQGAASHAGHVRIDGQHIRVSPSGAFDSVEAIGATLIRGHSSSLTRLADQATLTRGVVETPSSVVLYNGRPAIGVGVSTISGGNVVTTGQAVQARLQLLEPTLPLGVELNVISYQPDTVSSAVEGFLINLAEAVAIVVGLLLLFMGLRSGLIIGAGLLLTILGTFIFMDMFDITLQRISLGALVIALGMLVDNAIVVTEGILVRIQRGVPRLRAASESVQETMWPLLGATLIAILAFAAISLSSDSVGEFLSSLFQVIAISLLLSWVLAITVVPLFAIVFLDSPKPGAEEADPYNNRFFALYRTLLKGLIHYRWLTLGAVGAALVVAVVAFGSVKQNFFPESSRPQFFVNVWNPEGTHIRDTERDMAALSKAVMEMDGVESVTAFVGQGGLRFILTYEGEMPNSAYGQLLVTVDDYNQIDVLRARVEEHIRAHHPKAQPITRRFALGPGGGAKIEARFQGPDPNVLRDLSAQAQAIMRAEPDARDVRDDWRSRVPVVRPRFAEAQARRAGVSRKDLSDVLALSTTGVTAGLYREGDRLLPVILRLPEAERTGVDQLEDAQVWSRVSGRALSVQQVLAGVDTVYEDSIIRRRNRRRTITAQSEPRVGVASAVFAKLRPKIEAIELPAGYTLEWGGEHESSSDANAMLVANVPLCFALMLIIVIGLFNAIRPPLIVFLTLPLAITGVTAGLLLFDQPFGFVATLGFLSLSGMLIKNAIVLLEQIQIHLREDMEPFTAVVEAGVTRVRPVALAAFTTVLGMIPLAFDVFFGAMAVTIMAGLTVATLLTLLVVPVLYATFYRISEPT